MKSTGIIRNIDELGRIVIPKEIRKKLGIASTDPVEIFIEGEKIILTRYQACCSFCDSSENVTEFKGKRVCRACLYELRQI